METIFLPKTLIHGTTTGLLEKAIDKGGVYSKGFDSKTLEGFPTYFSFPMHTDYCLAMATRLINGKSDYQKQIMESMRGYNLGKPVVLEFHAGNLPPVGYVFSDLRENQLFTNGRISLEMLTEKSRKDIECELPNKAIPYFNNNPLLKNEQPLRIIDMSYNERLSLFLPEERENMKKIFEKYKVL